jgi:hypothetical protein
MDGRSRVVEKRKSAYMRFGRSLPVFGPPPPSVASGDEEEAKFYYGAPEKRKSAYMRSVFSHLNNC